MPISQWPISERPRERLLNHGAQSLSDAELLAIFLRTGCRGRTAVDLARDLLATFGGLRGLLAGDQRTLTSAPGMGPAKYAQLRAVMELAQRHLHSEMVRDLSLESPTASRRYLKAWLRDQPAEVFAGVFLDNRHRVIATEALFQGTIDSAFVHPREVVRRCISHNAAAIIVAHNHPSGIAEPSAADRQITNRLREALALIDVRLIDHLVIGDAQTVSFVERGWL